MIWLFVFIIWLSLVDFTILFFQGAALCNREFDEALEQESRRIARDKFGETVEIDGAKDTSMPDRVLPEGRIWIEK